MQVLGELLFSLSDQAGLQIFLGIVVLQQVDHHLDQLLQGHVDQRTGDQDLGLRGRTFDQGLVFLVAAL